VPTARIGELQLATSKLLAQDGPSIRETSFFLPVHSKFTAELKFLGRNASTAQG
jgi:hypothetical protein